MNIEEFRDYCINKPFVTEGVPFGPDVLVLKVHDKMFALAGMTDFDRMNLKCEPERALELRAEYNGIEPGYHMSKKHWNTVKINFDVPHDLLFELIDHSYDLVFSSLPKKLREQVEN
jgi:predicted DNA-binding protein (MmcQ/YjbR family)